MMGASTSTHYEDGRQVHRLNRLLDVLAEERFSRDSSMQNSSIKKCDIDVFM